MTEPKFKIGVRVILSIPRDDIDFKFNGKTGIIENINKLTRDPEYDIKFDDGTKTSLHFLERDIESYPTDLLTEAHLGLKCPDCGKDVMMVKIPDNNPEIKSIIFKCLFSATFDVDEPIMNMQKRLDDAKREGKLENFGIKGEK